jgi:L-threonylcarbamoyladenylate synthase
MEILNKDEYKLRKQEILFKIKNGAVFIYPTDTIYGIGSNALHSKSVDRIREAKERSTMPFSVIAPSKEWIKENCNITKEAEEWLNKLPGPYTLIVKLKNKNAIESNVNVGMETIGIRIPEHWTSNIARELNVPIITTSANVTTKEFMTSLEDLDPSIQSKVDFIIYEGEIKGRPSTLVDLTKKDVEIKKR